ncbi:MAG: hypothetical protein EZS28_041862, partial [Streblomastix strix]
MVRAMRDEDITREFDVERQHVDICAQNKEKKLMEVISELIHTEDNNPRIEQTLNQLTKEYSVSIGGHILDVGDLSDLQSNWSNIAWKEGEGILSYVGECGNILKEKIVEMEKSNQEQQQRSREYQIENEQQFLIENQTKEKQDDELISHPFFSLKLPPFPVSNRYNTFSGILAEANIPLCFPFAPRELQNAEKLSYGSAQPTSQQQQQQQQVPISATLHSDRISPSLAHSQSPSSFHYNQNKYNNGSVGQLVSQSATALSSLQSHLPQLKSKDTGPLTRRRSSNSPSQSPQFSQTLITRSKSPSSQQIRVTNSPQQIQHTRRSPSLNANLDDQLNERKKYIISDAQQQGWPSDAFSSIFGLQQGRNGIAYNQQYKPPQWVRGSGVKGPKIVMPQSLAREDAEFFAQVSERTLNAYGGVHNICPLGKDGKDGFLYLGSVFWPGDIVKFDINASLEIGVGYDGKQSVPYNNGRQNSRSAY